MNEPFGVLLLAVRAAIMAGHSDIKSAYLAGSGVLDGINRDAQETDAPQARLQMHHCHRLSLALTCSNIQAMPLLDTCVCSSFVISHGGVKANMALLS